MITRNALGAVALATTCLTPLAAFADDFNLGPATPATGAAAPAASGSTVGGMPFWGSIELGIMGVVGDNPNQAGRYNGLNTNGIDGYANFSLTARSPWTSDGARYYNFTGDNLVFQGGDHLGTGLGNDSGWATTTSNSILNSGSLMFKAGDQGVWGVRAYYDATTYTGNVIDSIYTVNGGYAYLNQPLVNYGGATAGAPGRTSAYYLTGSQTCTGATTSQLNPCGLAALEAADQPVQVGTRRDVFGTDFKYTTGPWTFSGAVRHEHKEGSVEETFDGAAGGTAFALPIDFDNDRYDATAAYNTRNFQGVFTYTLSHFVDNINFINIPYYTSNTKMPYQLNTAYALPPSNDAHYLTLMLADNNLIPKTRLNLNARYGWELQNDTNPPNNADPGTFGQTISGYSNGGIDSSGQGTSSSSPDIVAQIFQAKLSATSHPFDRTDARVYYGIDTRNVSLNEYNVVGTGNSGADTGPGYATAFTGTSNCTTTPSGCYSFIVPQTWVKQNAGIDLGYMVLPEYQTKWTVGYRYDGVDRSNAQVSHSNQSTASTAVLTKFTNDLDGKLSFDYSDRSGVLNYVEPWENLEGKVTGDFSGAYFQAPLTSESVTARLDYNPWQKLAGEIFVQFKNENYHYPSDNGNNCGGAGCLDSVNGVATTAMPTLNVGQGVQQDFALVVGPDVTYRPMKDVNVHFFYTFEEIFWKTTGNGECSSPSTAQTTACNGVAGVGTSGTGYNAANPSNGAGYFYNTYNSGTHTVGLSGDWKVNDKLKLKGEYTLAYGSVMFAEYNGVFLPSGVTPTAAYQNVTNYPDIDSLMNNLRLTGTYEIVPNLDLIVSGSLMTFRNNDWNYTTAPVQQAGTAGSVSILSPAYPAPTYTVGQIMAGVKFRF